MQESGNNDITSKKSRSVASIAVVLLGAVVLFQPDLAHAREGGGHDGGHGGGFHSGFTAADFTVMSLPCTTVSLMSRGVTGIMAGATDAMAGGWSAPTGVDISYKSLVCG